LLLGAAVGEGVLSEGAGVIAIVSVHAYPLKPASHTQLPANIRSIRAIREFRMIGCRQYSALAELEFAKLNESLQ
jgi:hypothetical protein